MINYTIHICLRNDIRDFIEQWHYSHNINGVISDYCFCLKDKEEIVGGAIFGRLAMANQWKPYVDKPEDILELRRLCCIDNTPKNTESYFIGHCLRWLQNNTEVKKILSYADETYGHQGTIYKASNFEYLGKTTSGKMIDYNGKLYHDKTIRTKYKGELKPFAKRLKEQLEAGEATWVKTKGKHIYLYNLDKHRKKPKRNKE